MTESCDRNGTATVGPYRHEREPESSSISSDSSVSTTAPPSTTPWSNGCRGPVR